MQFMLQFSAWKGRSHDNVCKSILLFFLSATIFDMERQNVRIILHNCLHDKGNA